MNIEDLPPEIMFEIFSHLPLADIDICRKVNDRWADIADIIIQDLFDISHLGPNYITRKSKLNLKCGNIDSTNTYESCEESIKDIYKFSGDAVHDFQHKTLVAEIKGVNVNEYFYEDHGEYDNALCKNGSYRINMAKEITQADGSRAAFVKGVSTHDYLYSFLHRPMWKVFSRQAAEASVERHRNTSEIYNELNKVIREQSSEIQSERTDDDIIKMMEIAIFSEDVTFD